MGWRASESLPKECKAGGRNQGQESMSLNGPNAADDLLKPGGNLLLDALEAAA